MNAIIALAVKDLRLLRRDKVGFIFTFVFPMAYAVFFGAIFSDLGGGATSKLKIAIVDEDQTANSAEFVDTLQNTSEVEVAVMSRDEALRSVKRGNRLAYVTLPPGFGAKRDALFFGEPPEVVVGIDPSRKAEAGMLQGVLIKCAFKRIQDLFQNPDSLAARIDTWQENLRTAEDMDPVWRMTLGLFLPALKMFAMGMPRDDGADEAAGDQANDGESSGGWQPVVIKAEPIVRKSGVTVSSYAWSFPQGIIWGVMGCAATFGISLVVERTSGTLVRLRMAPLGRWQILVGKAGACFVTTVCMMVVLLGLARISHRVCRKRLLFVR
jgi:ABC-2 type transport system permease protein